MLQAYSLGVLFVGAEARYLRQYESLGFDAFAGQALFVGPNLFFKPSERWRVTAARHHVLVQAGARDIDDDGGARQPGGGTVA